MRVRFLAIPSAQRWVISQALEADGTGFYRFPVLGWVVAERCQASVAPPHGVRCLFVHPASCLSKPDIQCAIMGLRPLGFFIQNTNGIITTNNHSQEAKRVVVGKHGGLPLYHSPHGGVSLMSGGDGVRPAGHKIGPQAIECALGSGVGRVDVRSKVMDVHLHLPHLDSLHDGDTDAGADIAHEVKNAGGIAHAIKRNGILVAVVRGTKMNPREKPCTNSGQPEMPKTAWKSQHREVVHGECARQ